MAPAKPKQAQRSETAGQGKERRTGTIAGRRCATPANQTQMQMRSACEHCRAVDIPAAAHLDGAGPACEADSSRVQLRGVSGAAPRESSAF